MEPTWNSAARQMRGVPVRRSRATRERAGLSWLLDAAPYGVAAVWMTVTFAALIGSAVTGSRELLEWCRSDAGLASAGTLAGVTALVGSVQRGVRR